ncbi:MAG: hypothetical protein QOH56_745 [Pseudonocardiales bacterium]|nr:hypothetical protein [Frankiales bacterium]MDQ1734494.1 hypothetical protein [Pseudonocardiales bacterium]
MRRWTRLALRAYHLHCAREDARVRHLVVPLGVWVCEHCRHVSLNLHSFNSHRADAHA